METKKKRFVYKAVVDKTNNPSDLGTNLLLKKESIKTNFPDKKIGSQVNFVKKDATKTDFPDDFNVYASQPSKKIKLSSAMEHSTKLDSVNQVNNADDLLADLIDDDFVFSEAAQEIDQLEVEASQKLSNTKKKVNTADFSATSHTKMICGKSKFIFDEFDNRNEIERSILPRNKNKSTLYLKLPEKKRTSLSTNETESSTSNTGSDSTISTNKENVITELKSVNQAQHVISGSSVVKAESVNPQQTLPLFSTVKNDRIMSRINTDQSELEKQLYNAQEQVREFKVKLKDTERKYNSKDGEIKILRETLRKLSEEEFRYKDKVRKLEIELKTKQSEKESDLISEVEKLKTQLQFKEKEVQDILERQQQLLKNNEARKNSPKAKTSPSAGFSSDGFKMKKEFIKPSHSVPNLKSLQKIPRTENVPNIKFQCPLLKTCLGANFKQFSVSNKIIRLLRNEQHHNFKSPIEWICNHNHRSSDEELVKRDLEFMLSTQTCLELLEHDPFFVTELMDKIVFHLKLLKELFAMMNIEKSQDENINRVVEMKHDESAAGICLQCDQLYTNGMKVLLVLKEACAGFDLLSKYLLNGLIAFQQQQQQQQDIGEPIISCNRKEVDGKEYFFRYPGSDKCVLVQSMENIVISNKSTQQFGDDLNAAIQFWSLLHNLKQNKIDSLEERIFSFYISLSFFPSRKKCESLFTYVCNAEILTTFLCLPTLDRIIDVLQILQNFVGLQNVNSLMCSKSDRCPLSTIYNRIISVDVENCEKLYCAFQELVCLLSSYITRDQTNAFIHLLENECRCSNEIIECLVTYLFDEFKYLQLKVFLPSEEEMPSDVK